MNRSAIFALAVTLQAGRTFAQTYTYTPFAVPNAVTTNALGISGNTVVGSYNDSSGNTFGFTESGGVYMTLSAPNAGFGGTTASGMSGATVVGSYSDASGNSHGFTELGGNYTTLDALAAFFTFANAISGATVVGSYEGFDFKIHGFIENGGGYNPLNVPGAQGTFAQGISSNGTIAGYYNDSNFVAHGFTESGGTYTTVNVPGAQSTVISGISGTTVAGSYVDSNLNNHGFVETGGVFTTLDDPNAAEGTSISGISGTTVVGSYFDALGVAHAFIATPAVTLTWASASSGNWDAAANWDLRVKPQAMHDVYITPSAGLTVTGPAMPAMVTGLTIGAASGIAQFSMQVGGDLAVSGALTIRSGGTLFTNGANLTAASLTNAGTLGQTGPGTLAANTFANNGMYWQNGGSALIGAVSGTGIFNQTGGTMTITESWGTTGAYNLSGGTLVIQGSGSNHALVQVTAGGLTVSGGHIDLANHDMIVFGAAANAGAFNTAMAAPHEITNASNGLPFWVTTAVIDAQTYQDLTGNTLFDFVSFDPGDLLLRYGLAGDISGDGQINSDDYLALDRGYADHLTGYANGDFNHDGVINAADYALIDLNFFDEGDATLAAAEISAHTAEFGAAYASALDSLLSPSAVPEPASLAIIGLGAFGLLRRRR